MNCLGVQKYSRINAGKKKNKNIGEEKTMNYVAIAVTIQELFERNFDKYNAFYWPNNEFYCCTITDYRAAHDKYRLVDTQIT